MTLNGCWRQSGRLECLAVILLVFQKMVPNGGNTERAEITKEKKTGPVGANDWFFSPAGGELETAPTHSEQEELRQTSLITATMTIRLDWMEFSMSGDLNITSSYQKSISRNLESSSPNNWAATQQFSSTTSLCFSHRSLFHLFICLRVCLFLCWWGLPLPPPLNELCLVFFGLFLEANVTAVHLQPQCLSSALPKKKGFVGLMRALKWKQPSGARCC